MTCAQIPNNAVFACEEGSCPSPLVCKAGFCVNNTCERLTCAGLGKNCGTLSDGCGTELECGTCNPPETCGGNTANVCSCGAPTTQVLCAEALTSCGRVETTDVCGTNRVLNCGTCGSGQTCFGGQCCSPQSPTQLCADRQLGCGKFTVSSCGVPTIVDCGSCAAGSQCIRSDTSSTCQACVSETNADFCYRTGIQCGPAPAALDNCGVPRTDAGCGPTNCADGRLCGADGGSRCECATVNQNCGLSSQCCGSARCGVSGLCCFPGGAACNDDPECCLGPCILGTCGGGDAGT